MFEKRGKKGISPLIATVLLIAFAVSIGAMIMSWGKDAFASSGDCTSVKLEIQTINTKPVFCYDTLNNRINFMVKNTGDVDVEMIKLRIINRDLAVEDKNIADSAIAVGGIASKNIDYIHSGKFHVEIIPLIHYGGKEKTCAGQAVVTDDIPACG